MAQPPPPAAPPLPPPDEPAPPERSWLTSRVLPIVGTLLVAGIVLWALFGRNLGSPSVEVTPTATAGVALAPASAPTGPPTSVLSTAPPAPGPSPATQG